MSALNFPPIAQSRSCVASETTAIARALSITVGLECRNGRQPSPLTYAQALDIIAWRERADRPATVSLLQRARRALGFATRN